LLGPDVQLRHTNYNATAACDRMRATDYPDAEEFVTQYVLNQPSAAEMLDLFTRVSLQSLSGPPRHDPSRELA
jgi:hypothetical protein